MPHIINGYKVCTRCKKNKPLSDYYKLRDKVQARCKKCTQEHRHAYPESDRRYEQTHQLKRREHHRRFRANLRTRLFEMYGGVCACCGESIQEFLTLEHKNGKTIKEKKRQGTSSYQLALEKYQPDLYEVLCMNCNHAKGRLGICPHQIV